MKKRLYRDLKGKKRPWARLLGDNGFNLESKSIQLSTR